uniref:Uncharacterized protein n=1 Tax=Capra hircus TaxID=9925 RepID=A0A452FUN2_CAPHI
MSTPTIPSSSLLMRFLGPTSLTSSCGSLPTADPEHRWASFFPNKPTLLFTTTVLESSEHSETFQAPTGMITCGLAQEQQPGGQPGKTNCRPPS